MFRLILLCSVVLWVSCTPKTQEPTLPAGYNGTKVWVLNEGNFQNGNASVSEIRLDKDSVVMDIYKAVNNSSLGDVAQSAYRFQGKIYIVVNNSQKIEVVDQESFHSVGKIMNVQSPRYFLPINDSTAFVSDLYANAISVVDLKNLTKKSSIPLRGWTEQMLSVGNYVFVTNHWGSALYRIHTQTFALDSISLSFGASSLVQDAHGKLWVLCGGNELNPNPEGRLWTIDPNTFTATQNMPFAPQEWSRKLCISPDKTTLYWLGGSQNVYQMPITQTTLPTAAFILSEGKNFYSLGVNPIQGDIYVTDVVDYQQKGKVYRYSHDGNLIKSYPVGIIPTDILF